jgi:hypothetical protein
MSVVYVCGQYWPFVFEIARWLKIFGIQKFIKLFFCTYNYTSYSIMPFKMFMKSEYMDLPIFLFDACWNLLYEIKNNKMKPFIFLLASMY